MAAPPVVPVANLGDGRAAVNSETFQHLTDQSTGHGAQWVCLNKGVQIVFCTVPNERPKFLTESVDTHIIH